MTPTKKPMTKFYYYWLKNKENLIFDAKNRDEAIKIIGVKTKESWMAIDKKLKSRDQIVCKWD
jgi:hypothetical protein